MNKSGALDFTEGSIPKLFAAFIIPIFISNIFQQLYNITNTFIVGNYVNKTALSAVSACTSIINISGHLYYGFGLATGILVARYFGKKDFAMIQKTIESAIIFALFFGLVFMLATEALIPFFISICKIQPELVPDATAYLRVYLIGNFPLMIYQISFATLRSLGDSKHSLIFLVISSFINLVLGMSFVRILGMSVTGPALATFIAQCFSAFLCMRLVFKLPMVNIDVKKLRFDWKICSDIITLGIPAALQNMLIAFSAMFVQTNINTFSVDQIAGIGVAEKLNGWVQIPIQSISAVTTSFVGQNLGAEKYDRIKTGLNLGIWLSTGATIVVSTIVFIFAEFFISIFNKDPNVIIAGAAMSRFCVFSYIPLGWSHIYNGACRGGGNMKMPLVIAVTTQVIIRALVVAVGLRLTGNNINVIYMSAPIAFTAAGIGATIYFRTSKWTLENHLR